MLAIITARAGSKRLINKNILELCGKPMIEYTLDAIYPFSNIEKIVTTDSEKIKEISRKNKYNKSFHVHNRPEEYAQDKTTHEELLRHILSFPQWGCFTNFLLLQPTSPLRNSSDIEYAINAYHYYKTKCLISVCYPNTKGAPNGAIYIRNIKDFLYTNKIVTPETITVHLEGNGIKDIDIDTIDDFKEAERRLKIIRGIK